MLLQGKKTLVLAVILAAIVLFNSCGGPFGGDPKKEVNREIKSISRLLNSKKIKELKSELTQLKADLQETDVNVTMLEHSVANLKLEADRLKSEFEELLSKETGEDADTFDEIRLLKNEIRLVEKDIKQLRKSKKRSDIQIWEQER